MKIDYSKYNFTREECDHMLEEFKHLQEEHPKHVPVLIMSKSAILKMKKHKLLVNDEIIFSEFITNTLKKKLIGLNQDDILSIFTVKLDPDGQQPESTKISINSSSMRQIYDEYKDDSTNLLILKVSRNTTYKYLKQYAKYWLGY